MRVRLELYFLIVLTSLAFPSGAFNPYGVVTDGSRSEYDMHDGLADLIKVGGMGYERVDWDWRACQKEKGGAFDFSRYDKIVEADEARGVTVLPIVYGPPSWAYPAWQHLDGYAAFVRETVRRYGKRMPVIEIWNEQNIAGFWKNPNPTNYLALLKVAYKAAKEVDPSVRVALGGTAGWAHGFIRSLYAIGAKDYFDIVNVHPYCYPYPPEEPLRKGFEELRKIMAEYGDAEKPIWFTEIGWPTHEVDLTGPGNVLLAGLKTARPEKTSWNVIYAVCKPDGEKPDQSLAKGLLARLPPGSTVRVCAPKETCERLAEGGWDAVVYPLDESYPADTLDAVVEFVRKGGTLIDLGGMPMWNPYRNLPDGSGRKFPHDGGRERFKRLRIGLDSWWLPGSELPRTDGNPMKVYATPEGLAAGVKQSPTGFPCGHFFTGKALGPNDRMVPLIAGTNPLNGKPAVAACTYLFDGDMKGRVVVCGIQKGSGGSAFPVSEHLQGVMFARAMGISFAEGVEAFFWYSLRAREIDRYYNEHHFGMVHANLVPKDGWLANKMFITQRPAGSVNLGGEWRRDGIYFPQWKRPDGKVGGMIWTDRAAQGLNLTFDADDVVFHDMWGKPAPVYGTGRTRQVQVTGEPLYFTGTRLLSFSSNVGLEETHFSLSLKQKPGTPARTVRSSDAGSVVKKPRADGGEDIVFVFKPTSPVREACVTLRRAPDGAVRSKLSCEMNPGWHLERTSFPEVNIPCEKATRLMLGSNKGGVYHDPVNWKNGRGCYCASPGSCCAQFAAAWNDAEGLYLGMEDAKGYMKTFGFARTAGGIRFAHCEKVWTIGSYTQDYWIVSRRVEKGAEPLRWYDFADIYKAWDRKQAWSRTPFLVRTDIPAWMKDAPAFTRFSRQWIGRPEAIRKFTDWWKRDIGDKPVVAALWGWEKVGTWWGPDYFPCHPSDEVFAATMKELRGKGFHPFAWPSGYNWSKVIGDKGDGTYEWDGREQFIKPVEGHLVVNEDGSLCHIPAFWLRNGALTTICGGDEWSHEWWNGVTKELARRGCDIVQIDQVVGGKIRTCWSSGHGHPVGDGIWMWQTFRRQMEEMHAAMRSVEPNGLIGVEEPNMMYNDLVGIQDYRDLESTADEFASVYSYLYHGYVPTFQSNPFRDEFFSLAHAATDGQMPFYRPDFAELEPSRPILQNGGFENFVDSVRGPSGWDRLMPNRLLFGVDASKPLWNFAGHNNMGWLGYAATLEYGDKHGGEVSLLFDVPAKGGRDNGMPIQVSQTIDGLEPGEYMVSAWVKPLNGAPSGRDALPRVRTGSLKYGTRAGEQGEIAFPAEGGWTKVSAKVRTGTQLRLVLWAPLGAKFLVDDIKLTRNGREVAVSGDSPYTRFMKKWIALYQGEGKAFLANGFQVKPPALQCDSFCFAARRERAVCYAAYESASGERALALANATDKPQRVTGEWKGRKLDITLSPHDLRLVK